jgi:hypothetical protein
MHRARILTISSRTVLRNQNLSTNKPSTKTFDQLWEYAKPKLEKTQAEVSHNAERVLTSLKGSVLEMMARRMPKDSRAFLADRWGFLAADVDQKVEAIEASAPQRINSIPPEASVKQESTNLKPESSTPAVAIEDVPVPSTAPEVTAPQPVQTKPVDTEPVKATPVVAEVVEEVLHPILGKLVCALNYKKVYITNVSFVFLPLIWLRFASCLILVRY